MSSKKPAWLTRSLILTFALALIAKGLFTPIYQTLEEVVGKERAAELFGWAISAKDELESGEDGKPPVDIPDTIQTNSPVEPNQPPPTPMPSNGDELDVSGGTIRVCSNSSHNRYDPAAIPVTHVITSARVEGGNVRLAYSVPDSYWASKTDHMKFARGQVYWKDGGKIYGGHFDWFRPGQTVKTMGNVYNGYLTRKPPSGATLYFVLVSNDGRQRTNLKASR